MYSRICYGNVNRNTSSFTQKCMLFGKISMLYINICICILYMIKNNLFCEYITKISHPVIVERKLRAWYTLIFISVRRFLRFKHLTVITTHDTNDLLTVLKTRICIYNTIKIKQVIQWEQPIFYILVICF